MKVILLSEEKKMFVNGAIAISNKAQLNQTMEECAELIKACSKVIRYGYNEKTRSNLAEEMSHVVVMIIDLIYRFDNITEYNIQFADILKRYDVLVKHKLCDARNHY